MRTPLFASGVGLVERVESQAPARPAKSEHYSPDYQIAFPYRGTFTWHVGDDQVVGDPNQVLFITGGEPFRVTSARGGEFAEVIITPALSVVREVAQSCGFDLERHPLFTARRRAVTPRLQRHCAALAQNATSESPDELAREEQLLALIGDALRLDVPGSPASPETRRLIARTKELLEARFTERLRLATVASDVGASPAYLTTVFQRFEGMSLQRYVKQLRLARALVELPHTDNLTTLALELGFSSHSHFTADFRRAFGIPPSRFRKRAS